MERQNRTMVHLRLLGLACGEVAINMLINVKYTLSHSHQKWRSSIYEYVIYVTNYVDLQEAVAMHILFLRCVNFGHTVFSQNQ